MVSDGDDDGDSGDGEYQNNTVLCNDKCRISCCGDLLLRQQFPGAGFSKVRVYLSGSITTAAHLLTEACYQCPYLEEKDEEGALTEGQTVS